jgi:hypothetical protein
MAKTRTSPPQHAATTPTPSPASDLDILVPDRHLNIGGKNVTVREITFGEQLSHNAELAALTNALKPALTAPGEDALTVILDILADHADTLTTLLALSTDQPREWVEQLNGDSGEALTLTWWNINNGFFIRRLLRPALLAALQKQLNGAPSSPPSSATDTATPTS